MPHREAARLVSCSQTGAGAWLTRLPDVSVRGSISTSIDCVTQCQRRLGLYLSALSVPLDACEMRGMRVTQHDRLGDAAINTANATHRHNEGLNAIYTAMRCASTATNPVRLGDKGDGTPGTKAEAKQRHAHLNEGHIPDIYTGSALRMSSTNGSASRPSDPGAPLAAARSVAAEPLPLPTAIPSLIT